MSIFLSLDSDPISQPAAQDPIEERTWCSLRIRLGSRCASRLWDKRLDVERESIEIPAFPIAEWLIQNWWALFHELCPEGSIPSEPTTNPSWLRWMRRHCLRAADSALFLPRLFLYTDGDHLLAESQADSPGSLPNMPGEFLHHGVTVIGSDDTQAALANFINQTLHRVEGIGSDRATQAKQHWDAINRADRDEAAFCKLAGRMGLDPYDPEEMTSDLAEFFEALTDVDNPLVQDLTEAAKPESVRSQWDWVQATSDALGLGPSSLELPFQRPERCFWPAEYGYELALRVRESVGNAEEPIASVEETASAAMRRRFDVVDRSHRPGGEIQAIAGEDSAGRLVVAGPVSHRPDSRRFKSARGFYHVLATCETSQRLVTAAYSWQQKASRAFAAELLAPRRALLNRLAGGSANPEFVETQSQDFQASSYVIQWQLENAGVALSSD